MAANAFKSKTCAIGGFLNALKNSPSDATTLDALITTPDGRTVFMDSNIALTNGTKLNETGCAVIPSLYDAIVGLQKGLSSVDGVVGEFNPSDFDNQIDVSTVLSGLYTKFNRIAGTGELNLSGLDDRIATNEQNIDVITANYLTKDIASATYYTIANHESYETAIDAILGDTTKLGEGNEYENIVSALYDLQGDITALEDQKISSVEALLYVSGITSDTFVIYPGNGDVTDGQKEHAGGLDATKKLRLSAQDIEFEIPAPTLTGYKIRTAATAADGTTSIPANSYWIPVSDIDEEHPAGAAGSSGTIVKVKADGTPDGDITFNVTVGTTELELDTTEATFDQNFNRINTVSTQVYTLGAIIEAIQELNRRTMFMDTDMSFHNAVLYQDTVNGVNGASAENKDDGLPGASNANLKA